jgi:pyruvate dehydrogenase E1 component alpha subunit
MKTYRYRGHSMSDPAKYRTRNEVEEIKKNSDPIENLKQILLKSGITEEDLKLDNNKIKETINEAAIFAQESPEPSIDELFKDITIN